jgi:hypothetical protein
VTNRRHAWLVAIAVVALLAGAAAPKHPDLSGTWKLAMDRSDLGKFPGQPKARTDVIAHREPRLVQTLLLENASGPDTAVYRYSTDGKPDTNFVAKATMVSWVWWSRDTLRVETKAKFFVMDLTLSERWSLSPDRKTLTIRRHIKYPLGEGPQLLVFDRQ